MEKIIFILIVIFGPSTISVPFVSLYSINNKITKKFWIVYSVIDLIITLIWSYIWLTQIPGRPISL